MDLVVNNSPANAGSCKKCGFSPRVGKIPWSMAWQPTPVFLLENSLNRGAWQATVHGITKSQT